MILKQSMLGSENIGVDICHFLQRQKTVFQQLLTHWDAHKWESEKTLNTKFTKQFKFPRWGIRGHAEQSMAILGDMVCCQEKLKGWTCYTTRFQILGFILVNIIMFKWCLNFFPCFLSSFWKPGSRKNILRHWHREKFESWGGSQRWSDPHVPCQVMSHDPWNNSAWELALKTMGNG